MLSQQLKHHKKSQQLTIAKLKNPMPPQQHKLVTPQLRNRRAHEEIERTWDILLIKYIIR